MKNNLVVGMLLFILIIAGVYLVDGLNTKVSTDTISPVSYLLSTSGTTHGMNHGLIASEKDFIKEMIPHHQEAITTSKYLLEKYPETKIKEFLENVIEVQAAEIETMKVWYKEWFKEDYVDVGTYEPMMADLRLYTGAQLEIQYITGMIEHHEGAIVMARNLMPIAEHEELKSMANAIVTTQTQEVNYLKSQY